MWKSTAPVYGDTCENGAGKILKDGNCWRVNGSQHQQNYSNAVSYCSGVWRLPTQGEIFSLATAYGASFYYNGSHVCNYSVSGDLTKFWQDLGITDNTATWSSTICGGLHWVFYINGAGGNPESSIQNTVCIKNNS